MALSEIKAKLNELKKDDKNILLLNLLHDSDIIDESYKNSIIDDLIEKQKEDLIEKTLYGNKITMIYKQKDCDLINKTFRDLDRLSDLETYSRNGDSNITQDDLEYITKSVERLCKSDKCNISDEKNTPLICLMIKYYTTSNENIDYIVSDMVNVLLNNKYLIISYTDLNNTLTKLFYNSNEKYYNSLYKTIKEKVIKLNNSIPNKTINTYTYWDVEEIYSKI